MNRAIRISFFLILYALIGIVVAGSTERIDGADFDVIDFLFVVAVWPIVLLGVFL